MRKKEVRVLILCIVIIISGIILVNKNSSTIVKDNSAIQVRCEKNPKVILKLGEKQIIFNTDFLYNVKNGAKIIYNKLIN
ncbi:MAG: hypothetical protein ACRCW0_00445 [Clostridium sp.]